MEFLKSAKRRSFLSEAFYLLFNIGLAVAIFLMVLSVENPWLPLLLAVLSKWRVFAVRPRYWWANLLGNSVDITVSLSYVILLYASQGVLALQVALLVAFIVWLLVIKPGSSQRMIALQALSAVLVGSLSLGLTAYATDSSVFVIVMWAIGYVTARHLLGAYNDTQMSMLSLIWGFVMAELGWLSYQWLFAYSPFGTAKFKLLQLALIATAFSFLAGRVINLRARGELRRTDIVLPAVFSLGLVIVLVLFFNNVEVVGSI